VLTAFDTEAVLSNSSRYCMIEILCGIVTLKPAIPIDFNDSIDVLRSIEGTRKEI
jgi:hypothetical protein